MISEIVIPSLGATGGDVTLEAWLAEPGQAIQAGTPLFVVTTDKATVEVEAYRSGYLVQQLVQPGTSVPVGTPVALLADSPLEELPEVEHAAPREGHPLDPGSHSRPARPGKRRLSSPLARRMAQQAGLDLAIIPGSGPQGAILKRDVLKAAQSQRDADRAAGQNERQEKFLRAPVSPMRRAIARQTGLSKSEIPHFYASATIDMGQARDFLAQAGKLAEKRGWAAPTITDLILRAVALALRAIPQLNASFQGDEIWLYQEVNLGFVVGLSEGMVIPVLRHADRKNLFSIARDSRRLKERAEAGTLSGMELSEATFTLSNLGMFGLDSFTAVINPPQAGILAVGAVRQAPAAWKDEVALRWLMTANLSVDHRAIDGVQAARFMQELRDLLENPAGLALEPPQEDEI